MQTGKAGEHRTRDQHVMEMGNQKLPFVPKVSVLAIFYPIRWLTPTDIHLPLSLVLAHLHV